MMTTGIRAHELLGLENDCNFTRIDDEGDVVHWIRGVSEKTYEGATEWICPALCHRAISIVQKLSGPLQELLTEQSIDHKDPIVQKRKRLESSRLFLGKSQKKNKASQYISFIYPSFSTNFPLLRFFIFYIGT